MLTTEQLQVIVSIIVLEVVLLIGEIFLTIRWWNHRHVPYVRARYIPLTALQIGSLMASTLTTGPYFMLKRVNIPPNPTIFLDAILATLAKSTAYGFMCLFAARAWIVYFNTRKSNADTNRAWTKFISKEDYHSNWFVRHHHTFGEKRNVVITAVVASIIFAGLQGVIEGTKLNEMYSVHLLWFILLGSFMIKMRKFSDDVFHITSEIKQITLVLLVYLFVAVGIAFLAPLLDLVPSTIVSGYLNSFLAPVLLWRITMVKSFDERNKFWRQVHLCTQMCFKPELASSSLSITSSTTNQTDRLLTTLRKHEVFFGFVQHVLREYSQENILYIIEISQLKQYIHDMYNVPWGEDERRINIATDYEDESIMIIARLPSVSMNQANKVRDVPESAIVFNEKTNLTYKVKALFDKYVKRGADFEVSISSPIRDRIEARFVPNRGNKKLERTIGGRLSEVDEMNASKLVNVFDDVTEFVLDSLCDSNDRFLSRKA